MHILLCYHCYICYYCFNNYYYCYYYNYWSHSTQPHYLPSPLYARTKNAIDLRVIFLRYRPTSLL